MSASLDKSIDVWDIDTEQRLAVWALDRDAPALAIRGDTICIGDRTGNVLFRRWHRHSGSLDICTATRAFRHDRGQWDDVVTCVCRHCDRSHVAASGVLDVIRQLGAGLTDCPHCHGRLRFNPFVVDGRDVETAAAFPRDNSFG